MEIRCWSCRRSAELLRHHAARSLHLPLTERQLLLYLPCWTRGDDALMPVDPLNRNTALQANGVSPCVLNETPVQQRAPNDLPLVASQHGVVRFNALPTVGGKWGAKWSTSCWMRVYGDEQTRRVEVELPDEETSFELAGKEELEITEVHTVGLITNTHVLVRGAVPGVAGGVLDDAEARGSAPGLLLRLAADQRHARLPAAHVAVLPPPPPLAGARAALALTRRQQVGHQAVGPGHGGASSRGRGDLRAAGLHRGRVVLGRLHQAVHHAVHGRGRGGAGHQADLLPGPRLHRLVLPAHRREVDGQRGRSVRTRAPRVRAERRAERGGGHDEGHAGVLQKPPLSGRRVQGYPPECGGRPARRVPRGDMLSHRRRDAVVGGCATA